MILPIILILAGLLVLAKLQRKPSTEEELMAAIDDLNASVARLETVADKVVANVPVDLTPAINAAKERVNKVSDKLEATLPPAQPENPA